jgi:hypothetical protein
VRNLGFQNNLDVTGSLIGSRLYIGFYSSGNVVRDAISDSKISTTFTKMTKKLLSKIINYLELLCSILEF